MKNTPPKPSDEIRWLNTIKKERYVPLRGTSFLNIYSTNPSASKPTDDAIRAGQLRRACEMIDIARQLGDELLEVWE